MKKVRTGRLSIEDMSFIKENIASIGSKEVAKKLNRTTKSIEDYANKEGLSYDNQKPLVTPEEVEIIKKLKKTSDWVIFKEEFAEDELNFFAIEYAKLMSQFGDDILPSEKTQIFQVIKFEILMHRVMKAARRNVFDIKRIEKTLTDLYTKHSTAANMDDNTRNLVMNLEEQLAQARSSQQHRSSEYVKLQDKSITLMRELKATREQRFDRVENIKKDYLGLIKGLQEEELRDRINLEIGLSKFATEKEKVRLGSDHKYFDKNVDKPILAPDTLED